MQQGKQHLIGRQRFPEVMQQGGFDVIVGIRRMCDRNFARSNEGVSFAQSGTVWLTAARIYMRTSWSVRLLKEAGLYSIIVANNWMRASYG